jgi:hypothetical protein
MLAFSYDATMLSFCRSYVQFTSWAVRLPVTSITDQRDECHQFGCSFGPFNESAHMHMATCGRGNLHSFVTLQA